MVVVMQICLYVLPGIQEGGGKKKNIYFYFYFGSLTGTRAGRRVLDSTEERDATLLLCIFSPKRRLKWRGKKNELLNVMNINKTPKSLERVWCVRIC
jgi:hypothetical protein